MSARANGQLIVIDNAKPPSLPPAANARRSEGTRADRDPAHRQTLSYGALAFERIMHSKLPADPQIYEIWYEYMRGQMPALNRAIDEIVARDQPMTLDEVGLLHDQFFSSSRIIDGIDTVGKG